MFLWRFIHSAHVLALGVERLLRPHEHDDFDALHIVQKMPDREVARVRLGSYESLGSSRVFVKTQKQLYSLKLDVLYFKENYDECICAGSTKFQRWMQMRWWHCKDTGKWSVLVFSAMWWDSGVRS